MKQKITLLFLLATTFLSAQISYTGFIDKYYIHMGYQQAYAYEKVVELIFEKGQLMEAIDHSGKVDQIRQTIDEKHEGQKDQMLDNINNFFSLRYNEKWEGFK